MQKKYYAVKNGRNTGVFRSWEECRKSIDAFSGAVYKSFKTLAEANDYLNQNVEFHEKKEVYEIDNSEEAKAYVDGSYDDATKSFSYGIVFFYKGKMFEFSKAFKSNELSSMRNVAGEIKGAEAAMQYCIDQNIHKLKIYHDYEGISRWCLGEWQATKKGTISYVSFYNKIKNKLKVKFVKVKGHSGDKYNELADKLAKKALGI